MTIWVYSGGRPSNGAKELAKLLGFNRLKGPRVFKVGDKIVNWGAHSWGNICPMGVPMLLNTVKATNIASNKHEAFHHMTEGGVQCVPWTVDHDVVDQWSADGSTIIGRLTLTGHSGHGIIIIEPHEPIQPAKLYTKYIFKAKEFRVHVVAGNVVDTQQKVRDPNKEPLSWKVRSHENGFIFTRNSIVDDHNRDDLAIRSCVALGLDFGAVDIVQDKKGEYYCLEVNTAPGLEGQTIKSYGDAFNALAG